MNWKTCLTGAGLALLGGVLAWREWTHLGARTQLADTLAAARSNLEISEREITSMAAALEACSSGQDDLRTQLQSQKDRSSNLQAQRDHLRAEVDRLADEGLLADRQKEALRAELESVRTRVLDLSQRPSAMESRLSQAHERIEALEASLDQASLKAAKTPVSSTFAGLSRDQTVFALQGPLPPGLRLPVRVSLADRQSILLHGWIVRSEGTHLIGHVLEGREPASTLVKGKKIFIFTALDHEPPP